MENRGADCQKRRRTTPWASGGPFSSGRRWIFGSPETLFKGIPNKILLPKTNVLESFHTDVLPRKRLFRLLDQMRKLPAIWVSGPAGSGKTTLVNTYLEARRIPLLTPEYLQDIEKAIDLYKGPFLADEMDQSWIISTRERCRSRFIRNLTWLGHYGQDRKDWGKALESFQRGLEIDDVAEDLYQEMMICYRELGRRAEALSVYQRCRKMLSTILGIAPSSKTEAIFESLIPGGNK